MQSRIATQGMNDFATMQAALYIAMNIINISPHGHSQRPIFQVSPDSVKLAILAITILTPFFIFSTEFKVSHEIFKTSKICFMFYMTLPNSELIYMF